MKPHILKHFIPERPRRASVTASAGRPTSSQSPSSPPCGSVGRSSSASSPRWWSRSTPRWTPWRSSCGSSAPCPLWSRRLIWLLLPPPPHKNHNHHQHHHHHYYYHYYYYHYYYYYYSYYYYYYYHYYYYYWGEPPRGPRCGPGALQRPRCKPAVHNVLYDTISYTMYIIHMIWYTIRSWPDEDDMFRSSAGKRVIKRICNGKIPYGLKSWPEED